MFPINFLPVLAATSAAKTDDNGPKNGVPEFPGEQPSDRELSDWLDVSLPIIRLVYGAVLRGDTPANLLKLKHGPDDLSDFVRIAVGSAAAGTMTAGQVAAHN